MDARGVKAALRGRHPGSGGQMPGPWTCVEEWRGIDLLAFSAWSSAESYARVGYEVKVSRSDMRNELLRPHKRAENVAWCNSFYFAVPKGMLTDEELAFKQPDWSEEDWRGERCPGVLGERCSPYDYRRRKHHVRVPVPTTYVWGTHETIVCPTCKGKGVLGKSRVEAEAPTLWVPPDVGLVEVDGRGTHLVKRAPRRKEVPALSAGELGQLVRFVSMRPDPRHAASWERRGIYAEQT